MMRHSSYRIPFALASALAALAGAGLLASDPPSGGRIGPMLGGTPDSKHGLVDEGPALGLGRQDEEET